METLQKRSLFWDMARVDPRKNEELVIERILAYGDKDDFKWANNFYGKEKIKSRLLESRSLDKKSLSFWCQFFNVDKTKCTPKLSASRQSAFWKR